MKLFFIQLDWVFIYDYTLNTLNLSFIYVLLPFNLTLIYFSKFLCAIFFLIFIRAGLPRYRYDYLSKLGWTRLLIIIIFMLLLNYYFFTPWL